LWQFASVRRAELSTLADMRVPTARGEDTAGGFTLRETIVATALVAFLAVVVIPAVVRQAGVGQPAGMTSLRQR
jgi:type II secretory pathway pseudopilin PulG